MSTLRHHRSVTWLAPGAIENSRYKQRRSQNAKQPGVPLFFTMALALAISSTIWLAAAWLIWTFAKFL
jgi:hypothetical protein